MTNALRTDITTNRIRRVVQQLCSPLIVVLVVLSQGCQQSQPRIVRPPLAELRTSKLELSNLKQVAPGAVSDTDPDMCPQPSSPDPHETSIGGLSSRSAYQFASEPHLQNLYARLVYQTQLCTANSLSSKDRSRLQAVLNFLKITNARSFAATMSLTGDGQGGVKYPQVAPFSYSYDESTSTYAVQTIGKGVIPWQATNAFDLQYSYNANTKLSINTTKLFSDIVTAVGGAGGTTALLSPAANAYLSAGQTILQSLAQSVFTQINTANDSYHFDMLQGPQGPDRSLTYRFRDLSSPPRPLAAVRFTVSFTNSIANPIPVDPIADDTSHIPHFDQLQPILNVTIGGPSGGQTLLQQMSKEQSYQDLLKSTSDTTPQSFRSSCDQLESALQTTYGLNVYDTALAMGQVLSQDTLYLTLKKFYASGCFHNRGVLKTMGITVFEQAPSS